MGQSTVRCILTLTAAVAPALGLIDACSTPDQDRGPYAARTRMKEPGDSAASTDAPVSSDPPVSPASVIYAHTAKALYVFDPAERNVTRIGDVDCIAPKVTILDIAVGSEGVLFATSQAGLLRIDHKNAACSFVKKGEKLAYPNSLAFIPRGLIDETQETLVGYQFHPDTKNHPNEATEYSRIDLADGNITKLGELNDPAAAVKYNSSGDLITVPGEPPRAYLTVQRLGEDAGAQNDDLAEVDPKTGRVMRIVARLPADRLWGLAASAGKAYAFSAGGEVIEIDITTGAASTVMTLKDEDGGAAAWYGAAAW